MFLVVALGLALVASEKVCAQIIAGDSLIVNLKNGRRIAIPLADIQKITFDTATASVPTDYRTQHSLEVAPSFPNPVRKEANIEFTIPRGGSVTISIYDAKGNLIRLLQVPDASAGLNSVVWDGLDGQNDSVPNGSYFYEVRFLGEIQTRRLMVLK